MKGAKIGIVISLILLVFSSVCIVGVADYRRNEKAAQASVLLLPEDSLSDDVFVAQNSSYKMDDELPRTIAILGGKYYIDMFDVDAATIDNTTGFRINDNSVITVSKITSEQDEDMDYLNGMTKMFFPGSQASDFQIEKSSGKTGYLNGYEAKYRIFKIWSAEADKTANPELVGLSYLMQMDGVKMQLAITVKEPTTELLKSAQDILDRVYRSVQKAEEVTDEYGDPIEAETIEEETTEVESTNEGESESSPEKETTEKQNTKERETTVGGVQ